MNEQQAAATTPNPTPTPAPAETLSVVIERDLPHLPERVWRALTEPGQIEKWLMRNDFTPALDAHFTLSADWGQVEGRVLAIEPNRTLTYTWESQGLQSVVTWTLAPTDRGTRLRMEQSGFRPDQRQAYNGARHGWPMFFDGLERTLVGGAA